MSETPNAARVGDPIEHSTSLFGALVGIAVGVVVGAIIAVTIIATAGTGLLLAAAIFGALSAVLGGAAAGYTLGGLLGKLGGSKSGVIAEGAATVFIGAGLPAAARVRDPLACGDPPITKYGWALLGAVLLGPIGALVGAQYGVQSSAHPGKVIATGSETVFIEKLNAARVEDETTCSGKIIEGAKTVGIGGPKVDIIPRDQWSGEIPKWLDDTMWWVDKAGLVFGVLSGVYAWRALGWKAVSTDAILTGIDLGLVGLEEGSAYFLGRDHAFTDTVEGVRATYETGLMLRTGRNNVRGMRTGTPDVPNVPRATTPDVPNAPRIDAPSAPSAPKPVPQGGQTIAERAAQGGNPPPWARQNPDNYYYNPANSRYMKR